jgi:membrane protein
MISRIIQFLNVTIWEIRLSSLSSTKALLIRYLRVVVLAAQGFQKDECPRRASALTYYSMLNVVPLAAVAFGIAKGFGLEKIVENRILQLAEQANWQAEITNQILTFSRTLLEHAKGGLIAGIGVVLLFWTVISILGKIEDSFNTIWEAKKARPLVRKFSDYIAMMVLGPLLLIISGSMTVVVASQVKVIVQKISLLGAFSPMIFFLLNFLPYVSVWVLLTLVYIVMPNTKVPLRSGILGGIAAGTIYQIVQWIYIKFQIGAAGYGAIYGSFAALPLFLAWLQLSWMIFLFGAEIAFANENYETYGFHPDYDRLSLVSKKILVLRIFHLLVKRFSLGEKPLYADQIARLLEIPVRLVRRLLHELSGTGLVGETASGGKQDGAFQPARSIENITVKYVIDAYEQCGGSLVPESRSPETEKILMCLKGVYDGVEKAPGNLPLKEI